MYLSNPLGVHVRKVNFRRLTKGVLHSKFWIIDRRHVYIGSPNMDWRALTQVKTLNLALPVCSLIVVCCRQTEWSTVLNTSVHFFPLRLKNLEWSSMTAPVWPMTSLRYLTLIGWWATGTPPSLTPGQSPSIPPSIMNAPYWSTSVVSPVQSTSQWAHLKLSSADTYSFVDCHSSVLCLYCYGVYLQASPPAFCPESRSRDLDAILSTIKEAEHFIYVAVMDYYPTTQFTWPPR